jgi:hypothetical protein
MNATPDSTFTNPEQLIADLQRQLVECKAERDEAQRKLNETTTERDEALAREAATAEVLRVINSSPGELAPVFEAVLQSAVRICEANFGTLYLRETDAFRAVAMHNAPPAYAEARTRALLQPPSGRSPGASRHHKAGGPYRRYQDKPLLCRAPSVCHRRRRVGQFSDRALRSNAQGR